MPTFHGSSFFFFFADFPCLKLTESLWGLAIGGIKQAIWRCCLVLLVMLTDISNQTIYIIYNWNKDYLLHYIT